MRDRRTDKLIDSRGFTLVELMIATLLLSVALLGIATLATVVIRGNLISKQITTSTALAQQKIEDYRSQGYASLTPTTHTEDYGTIPAADGTTGLYSSYKRESIIKDVPDANMRTLTVTVSRQGDSALVSLSTIITE